MLLLENNNPQGGKGSPVTQPIADYFQRITFLTYHTVIQLFYFNNPAFSVCYKLQSK